MMQSASGAAFAYYLQCLQIEYDRLALRAIADESASQLRNNRDTMTHLQFGNLALLRSCICVHYQDFAAMCQVKATRPGSKVM